MHTDGFLLIGCRERDGGDDGTGFRVWLRSNVDSACSKAIMTRFKGSSGGGGMSFGESGGVREGRRHFESVL